MLNLFGKSAFARKRKAKMMPIDTLSRIEILEDRVVLASQIGVVFSNGNLALSGSGGADDVVVTITGTNVVTLSTTGTFTGAGAGPFVVTGNFDINMGNGNDTVTLVGLSSGKLDSGNLTIDLGSGDDTLTTSNATSTGLTFTGNVSIMAGTGNDIINLGGAAAGNTFAANSLSVDTGGGATETLSLNRVTIGTNVTLKTAGTGTQSVTVGAAGTTNTIGGNLSITQANGAVSYSAILTNVAVTGNLSITNGNGGSTNTTVTTSSIGGATSIINGNSTTGNSAMLTSSTFTGNTSVKNGSSGATNLIRVSSSNFNGKSSSFANGAATSFTIIELGYLGDVATSTFAGAVSAINSSPTGSNRVYINKGIYLNGLTASNNVAGASLNQIDFGFNANSPVSIAGNVTLTNAASTIANVVQVSQLTTTGTKLGDVTANNGTSSQNYMSFGAFNQNVIGGNLITRNQAATTIRDITLVQTTVSGRNGAYLYNVGTSPLSTITLGVIGAPGAFSVLNALKIEDGSGASSSVNLQSGVLGSFNYIDLGGGTDTINIAAVGTGNVVINGVTRIDTGAGSDIVTIATTGTAFFNDLVVIALGSGADTLTIGDNAASPAFSTANKFQFDGGAGTDTFNGSVLSLADFVIPLSGKLKSKVTNFESLNYFVGVP